MTGFALGIPSEESRALIARRWKSLNMLPRRERKRLRSAQNRIENCQRRGVEEGG